MCLHLQKHTHNLSAIFFNRKNITLRLVADCTLVQAPFSISNLKYRSDRHLLRSESSHRRNESRTMATEDGVFFLDAFALRQWDDPSYSGSRISHSKDDFLHRVHDYHSKVNMQPLLTVEVDHPSEEQ